MPVREATTAVACLTPPGAGAIATLAVSGPAAWDIARRLFQPRGTKPLPDAPPTGKFWLGRMGMEKAAADLVVLAVKAPDWVEVHCHGGVEVVRYLEETLAAQGAVVRSWAEVVASKCSSPFQALALETLVQAPTVRTAAIALDQYHGAFERAFSALQETLARDAASAKPQAAILARYANVGRHLIEPFRVVIAGAPNVGKSSLVNALAGYTRSIVSPIPGTTRDVVATRLAIDGWPVELLDTAGHRTATDDLEQQGVARAGQAAATADLCLWVVDAAADPVWPPATLKNVQIVVNKTDLTGGWDRTSIAGTGVSARTGDGIEHLCELMSHCLVPLPPSPGQAVPFTPALADVAQILTG